MIGKIGLIANDSFILVCKEKEVIISHRDLRLTESMCLKEGLEVDYMENKDGTYTISKL